MRNITTTPTNTATATKQTTNTNKALTMTTINFTYNSTSDRFSLATKNTTKENIAGTLQFSNLPMTKLFDIIVLWSDGQSSVVINTQNESKHNMHLRFTKALLSKFEAMRKELVLIHKGTEVTKPTTKETKAKAIKETKAKAKADKADKAKAKAKALTKALKADTTKEAKNIHTTLSHITKAKAVIKTKQTEVRADVKSVIPMINEYVKELRAEDALYSEAKKATLIKIIKARLSSKETVINTVCDILILGLNLDNSLTLTQLKATVKYIHSGVLSKTEVNKATKAELVKKLDVQKSKDAIARAKKLIKG